MNVAGGTGGTVGDLPIFISAIKQDSVIGRSGKIQVSIMISSQQFNSNFRCVTDKKVLCATNIFVYAILASTRRHERLLKLCYTYMRGTVQQGLS